MIDFFKKHSFVIGTFSLGIGFLLEYLSQSKWLILPFAIVDENQAINFIRC